MRMHRRLILKMYALVVVLGLLVGLIGSCFQLSIIALSHQLANLYHHIRLNDGPVIIIAIMITMSMVFVAWLLVHYIAPEASGSGVPEIEGALFGERPVFWRRLLPVKYIGGVLAISAGMVLGREGPTIQMGGNLGEMLGSWFGISRRRCDTLIAAGAAAGLATAFDAPLAGVLLIIEEMRRPFRFSFTNFSIVAIGCVASTIVEHMMIGTAPAIQMDVFALPSLISLYWFFLLGILVGFTGIFFNNVLMWSLNFSDRFNTRSRMIFVLFIGALIGCLTILYPPVVGGGYEIIEQSLIMRPSLSILIVLFMVRFFIGMACYTSGVPGGIFAPMLALGTLLGLACSYFLKWSVDTSIHPGMFAVAGMGALFAAAVRAPLTGIVLVVEMTHNYMLILPLMVSCLTSTTIAQLWGNAPIYTQLFHRLLRAKH